jgi:hypothetical protein
MGEFGLGQKWLVKELVIHTEEFEFYLFDKRKLIVTLGKAMVWPDLCSRKLTLENNMEVNGRS